MSEKNSPGFFAELQRRNVYKVAIAYSVVAWVLIQIATQTFPFFEIPNWIVRAVILLLCLGLPVALLIAWVFELTPQGLKRTKAAEEAAPRSEGRAWIYVAVIGALLSIGLFFAGRYTAPGKPSELPAKSIAVLPFESLSEEKENAYFADGIQDEILARLSKIADLKVISRTSTQKYRSAPDNLREIAQQLGVTHILEGSVQKSAGQVRVTVQLINALNDSHLWAETYDRQLIDLFQVESDVAEKIANSLEAKLTGREKREIKAAGTRNPEAYDAYLHALAYSHAQGQENEENYAEYGRRAVALDPSFMEAWAGLAIAEAQQYFFPHHTPEQLARARSAAETALRLAPDSADAHEAMGIFYYYCLGDWDRAIAELKLARERAPNSANVLLSTGLVERRQGKFEESIASHLAATKLDPMNQDLWVNLARSYRGQRKFEEARAMFDRALAIEPNNPDVIGQKAETHLAAGDLKPAWTMIKDLKFPARDRGFWLQVNMLIYQRRFDDAIEFITTNSEDAPPLFRGIAHAVLGQLYRVKGETEKAQPYLEQAAGELRALRAQGDGGLILADTLLQVEATLGRRNEVESIAASSLEQVQNDHWALGGEKETVARGYTILGDFDRAGPLLQSALSATAAESLTPAYLRFDPLWDPVRNDPRFQEMTRAQP